MAFSEPNGWRRTVCNFCGTTREHTLFISIATDDPKSEYPFSQTDMCKECWDEYGLLAALEHNRQCRADCGMEDAPKRPRARRLFNEVALAAAYHSGYESGVEDGRKGKGAAS